MEFLKRIKDQFDGRLATAQQELAGKPHDSASFASDVLSRRSWRDDPTPGAVPITVRPYDDREPWVTAVDPETCEPVDLYEPEDQERLGAVRFPVAGTGFRLRDALSPAFFVGCVVHLEHERRNRHDARAIAVRSPDGRRTAGYVPRPKPPFRAQDIVHEFIAAGSVNAVVTDRSEEQGQQGQYVSIWVVAAPKLEVVDRPWPNDADYDDFRQHSLRVEGSRWPQERRRLRAAIRGSVVEKHFALQQLAQRAYALREHHPEALDDAEAACREQIDLAAIAGPALRQEFGERPAHYGFKQLAIILEKRKQHEAALQLIEQAVAQGWSGDWQKRRERLEKKIDKQQ